jgi:hypothetical protein
MKEDFIDLVKELNVRALRWPGAEQLSFKGNSMKHAFPAHSFTQIEIPYN